MLKNIVLFSLFAVLIGCGRHGNGYDGRDEDYVDEGTGYTMWLPKNMHERHYYTSVPEDYAKSCGESIYMDVNLLPDAQDVYKDDADGIRTYAFVSTYYANGGSYRSFDGTKVYRTVDHEYFFNIIMNQKGELLDCKYHHSWHTIYSQESKERLTLPIIRFK